MMINLIQDKNSNIMRQLNSSITEFLKRNVPVNENAFAKGVFGSVLKGYVLSLNQ